MEGAESKVIDLHEGRARRARREDRKTPFPDPIPLELTIRITKLARADGYTFAEVLFGTRTVMYWANGGNKEGDIVRKIDWAMTVVNGIRLGWALRGFKQWRAKNSMKPWMDQPLRQFLWSDLVSCLERRQRGDKHFIPRIRVETVVDPRLCYSDSDGETQVEDGEGRPQPQ